MKTLGVRHLSTAGELQDDLLSLCELLALIPQGLEAVSMMNFIRINPQNSADHHRCVD